MAPAKTLWLGLEAWRWMFIMMALPAILYGVLAFTIPESPRYLVAKYRIPEARKVLSVLLGEKNLELTITRIQESLKAEKPPSWSDLRKPTGGIYGIVWVGLGLSVFQQFVGINVIFYYSNILWEAVGFGESAAFVITVITSVTNIATTLIAIALVDKVGRKPLLLIGSVGMAVTLGTMAVIFGLVAELQPNDEGELVPILPGASGPIALIAANLFVVAFGMSWGPMVWVLLGEMFPNRIRAAALGLAAAGQWVANWLITVTFPGLRDHLGAAYGFYAVCAVLVVPVRLEVGRGNQGHAPRGHAPRGLASRNPPGRDLTRRSLRERACLSGDTLVNVDILRTLAPLRPLRNRRDFARGGVKQSRAVKTFDALFAELSERRAPGPTAAAPSPRSTAACTGWARRSSKRPARCGWPPSTRATTRWPTRSASCCTGRRC